MLVVGAPNVDVEGFSGSPPTADGHVAGGAAYGFVLVGGSFVETLKLRPRPDENFAYAEFGSSTEGWVDVIAGRQVLGFGAQRLIGPSDWSNTGRTFDAVRIDLHQPGYKISLFASSLVIGRDGVIDHHAQGNNLHGIYSTFSRLVPHATIEPYVLWRLAPPGEAFTQELASGALNEVTTGFRWGGEIPAAFDYEVEMARQSGSIGSKSIAAWAGHWELGKTFRNRWAAPRLFACGMPTRAAVVVLAWTGDRSPFR